MTNTSQYQATRLKKTKTRHFFALTMTLGLSLAMMQTVSGKNFTPPSIKANAPNVYVVKKGDTLWHISAKFLATPWRWSEIWAGNPHVKNPHLIYPGDRLLLCSAQGRSLVVKDLGDGCNRVSQKTFSPEIQIGPQIRVESLADTVPIIPLSAIEVWLERYIVVEPQSLTNLPYVLGMTADHMMGTQGDRIYLRGQGLHSGQYYDIYRRGEPYSLTDENGKTYVAAIELNQVATGVAISQKNDISTFEIIRNFNSEVRKGDLVLPSQDSQLPSQFMPVAAKQVREGGKVVRVMGSINNAALGNSVAIDRGHIDGVQIGHVFAVDLKGELTTDPVTQEKIQLPNQRVGHIMVYKAFEKISYGFILDSSQPIKLGAELAVPLSEE